MAVFLSSTPLKQIMHNTPTLSNISSQSYATPRQFTTSVQYHQGSDEALSLDCGHSTQNDMNKVAPPSQKAFDLPSWTPLRTFGDEESSSASNPEVDEISTRHETTDSGMKRLGGPPKTHTRATMKDRSIAGQGLKSSSVSDGSSPKGKTARFQGVLITKKPPLYGKHRPEIQRPGPAEASNVQALVDALARTFDANKHTDSPLRTAQGSYRREGAPTVRQSAVEITETEDEQPWLNTRLARTAPLKRRYSQVYITATSADASESNPEGTPQPDRPVKRLKSIPYDSNPTLIDAALGTVEAPIAWNIELDVITRDEDCARSVKNVHVASPNTRAAFDEGSPTVGSPRTTYMSPSAPVEDDLYNPALGTFKGAILAPYLSHGARFRQRLETIFGENATVRRDRTARPRPADVDSFAAFEEPDRESGPDVSESTVSVSGGATPTLDEGASDISSTHFTSQSPDILSASDSVDQLFRNQPREADSLSKPTFDAVEDQMSGWITALQRLVKGKIRVKEEHLEELSIILAEIESVEDSLDEPISMTLELFESLKQVSELHEIPFGDRNKLRQRAEAIVHAWPSMGKPGAS